MGRRTSLVRRPSRRSRFEGAIKAILFAAAVVSILTTLGIVFSLLRETIAFFGDVPIGDYLFGTKWTPQFAGDQQSFGVLPLIWGTLYLTGIGLLVAIPVGLLSGIYLSEFAPRARAQGRQAGARAARRRADDRLRLLRADVLHARGAAQRARASASTSSTRSRPASSSASSSCRRSRRSSRTRCPRCRSRCARASAGLGANRVQTAIRVVFPAALSGIVAALVLGASRAIGETVIILIAGGQTANLSLNPTESYQSMAAFIAATARGDIPTGSIEYETIFVVGMTLFVFTLMLNMISIRLVRKYRQVYE